MRAVHGAPLTLAIYRLDGKLMKKFSTMQNTVNLKKVSATGIYVVSAEIAGERLTRKVIIRP